MKIISWNVNGIRSVQSKGFAETLARFDADCILYCLFIIVGF
jgi:exodeoxyribonuclease-3